MSKKLDSILKSVPRATASVLDEPKHKVLANESSERIVAVIPSSLKRQIKQYAVDHPGETEKTILLKGLLALGFQIEDRYLQDNRGKK